MVFFHIPSEPLSDALEAFATTTGDQVLYDRPPGGQRVSDGVNGLMTPEAALDRLLRGSGLVEHFRGPRDVVLSIEGDHPALQHPGGAMTGAAPGAILSLNVLDVAGPPALEAHPSHGFEQGLYRELIQAAVRRALAARPLTAEAPYQIKLKLWVAPSGAFERVALENTTGNPDRDASIVTTLTHLNLGQRAPSAMPQPVLLYVRVDSMQH